MSKIILLFAFIIITGGLFYSGSKFFPTDQVGLESAKVSKTVFDLTPVEELGKKLFFDKIAEPDNMSCADCHIPEVGFTGPTSEINAHGAVYPGAVEQRFGNRKPPSAAYATSSPVLFYDEEEGIFVGGNFWDGRATGELLDNPAADQALAPFLNPVEQNNASKEAVVVQVAKSDYAKLWEEVWDEPISVKSPLDIEKNFDRIGLAIAAYEGSREVNQFSSKYDMVMAGESKFTEEEDLGYDLFIGKALCSECHPEPLFTDFTYDNLGVPRNPENPFYYMDTVYLEDGSPINPEGTGWIDKGLGGFLETRPEWADLAKENYGKHKVPTLRNVGKENSEGFTKAFMHNGVFKSLEEVVHFYNARDIEDWPEPEVAENVNTLELGNLGLTEIEEAAVVAFMMTLSDGYQQEK
jgi:cytochrome c peroxidase